MGGGGGRGGVSFFPRGDSMQDGGYDLGGRSVPLPPFSQFFLKFVSCFVSFGTLEEVFRVFVPMSASSWAFRGGPCSPFFYYCPYRQFSGGNSICPSLSGTGISICGELKRVLIYKMVGVLIESSYLVPMCQERRIE